MSMVKNEDFKIIKGEDKLTLYQFHSKVAKHYFCSVCGIYTHHNPRSNPAMTGFNVGCIDEINTFDLKEVPVIKDLIPFFLIPHLGKATLEFLGEHFQDIRAQFGLSIFD